MLTSLQNSLVKQLRKLHRARDRREQQLFLLEGTHLLEEACAVNYPLATLCCTPEWQANHEQLWQQVSQTAQRLELVSPEVLKAIATTVEPDGVIATAQRQPEQIQLSEITSLGLVLETIQDPGNLGTMIRAAAAAGAEGLWLSADSVDLDHPKVLRASAGQWFRLPMAVSADLKTVVADYQAQGMQVVATLPDAALTYWEADLRQPTLILLGNEGAGLSEEVATLADQQVKIPLRSGVESLNVAIAAALILYEAQRQRGFNPEAPSS
ncbi:MAG: RNA methyltransferase [Trichocoleus desertorum ATA4-8-CV12]|jgi:TrmH family RNA methyltransferase|nr:RNA methyltransferase [Trichocoleus desertorum ATA4-8-CV12]